VASAAVVPGFCLSEAAFQAVRVPRPLSLTTYLFTEISFASMIASVARSCDDESLNPFKLVEAED
jgi:hypothetical protein